VAGFELDGLALAALAALDHADGAAPLSQAQMVGRPLDSLLAALPGEAASRALAFGQAAAALARVVQRGGRPGESAREKRMRELAARTLELMHEAAAGMARISVG
jgi:hypothetical protein